MNIMFKTYRNDLKQLLCELGRLGAIAVKSEFEEEAADYAQAQILKDTAKECGLKFMLKMGGCSAFRDIKDAKQLDADIIVAPMVESAYALKKFIKGANLYGIADKKLCISIETAQALKNSAEIFQTPEFSQIAAVIFGRTDFGRSMRAGRSFADSDECCGYAKKLCKKLSGYGTKMLAGGTVTPESVDFLKKLCEFENFFGFETRKIVFGKQSISQIAILKALEFEILWLKTLDNPEAYARIESLEQRLSAL